MLHTKRSEIDLAKADLTVKAPVVDKDAFWKECVKSDIKCIIDDPFIDKEMKTKLLFELFVEERKETVRFVTEQFQDTLSKLKEVL